MQAIGLTRPGLSRIGAPAGLSLVPGAVAYWDCTQVVGQVLPDLSGNGNHATLGSTAGIDTNDPTPTAQGMLFSGDDWAIVGTQAAMNLANVDHTLICVCTPTTDGLSAIAGKVRANTNEWGLIRDGDNKIRFVMRGAGSSFAVYSDAAVPTGAPIVIHGVRSGATISLNIGGVLQADSKTVTDEPNTAAYAFTLGSRAGGVPVSAFFGTIHACRLVPRALSASEIAQNCAYFRAKFAPLGVVLP